MLAAVACLALALSACGGGDKVAGAAFAQPEAVAAPIVAVSADAGPVVDVTQASEGYVVACAVSAPRLKFQVINGGQAYNYDLPNDGTQEVYPLNMGNGTYTFRIMQNTSGSDYVELSAVTCDVTLDSEFAPFLLPNMFCSYEPSSVCVAKAREVTGSSANMGEAVRDVCEYVAKTIAYDDDKARSLSNATGYVPNPDQTLSSGSGVCFDYASLSAAMLRSLGIPTKVVTGYVGDEQLYHAWIMVFVDGTWHTAKFQVDPNTWSRCDVTFASAGSSEFVGDASSYTDRYTY